MSLLDEHWPADIFPTLPDSSGRDPGPRIVSLLRWVERLRPRRIETVAQLAVLPHLTVIRINPHPDDNPDDDESPVLEKRGLHGWYETGRTFPWREDQVAEMLPATLLWHPKDGVL